jgi:hypothetical protein
MALHVGSQLGDAGRRCEEFMQLLIKWNRSKKACRENTIAETDGSLDIVFRVEGKLMVPDFEGIRTGSFSKKRKILQIQIAVSSITLSSPNIAEFVVESLEQAVALGKTVLDKKGIPFCLEDHVALLAEVSVVFLMKEQSDSEPAD